MFKLISMRTASSAQDYENKVTSIVSEVMQHSQSLYSFTFNALFIIHEYIYSHSTTKFLFKKYIYSYLTTYFLFTKIFTHIYRCIYSHSTVYIRSHSQSLLVNSKVIASCYVSYGGQESHQRIRKGRDGHGLENPTDVKKNAKRIQK